MKFDYNALNFETLDANANSSLDIFFNQNGLTFSRRVAEELGFPAHILCLLDAKNRVFAIRACRKDESRAFKFSKPKEEQKSTICLTSKNLLDPLRKCTADIWQKGVRYKVTGFWVPDAKTMCFDLTEGEPQRYFNGAAIEETENDE